MKWWECGAGAGQCRVVAYANVDDEIYAIQAAGCPRCAFDLYEGDIVVNDDSFEDLPPRTIACPTCATRKCLLLTTYRWKKVSYVTNVKCLPSIPLELLLLRCPFEIKSWSLLYYSLTQPLSPRNASANLKPNTYHIEAKLIDYYLEHLIGTTSLEKCEVWGVHFARLCLELWLPTNAGSCVFARNAP